ncbi:DNA-binding barrel domain superfamily [Sesbania bispinosa]|nr:DNA-binding barrel domain superfamily [Sesbania bispinosa]
MTMIEKKATLHIPHFIFKVEEQQRKEWSEAEVKRRTISHRAALRIKDEEVNEILTPSLVKLRGNDNDHEVIDISPGSSENANVIVNEGVVDVGRQAGPGHGHRPVIICRRPARFRHLVQLFSFENVISKSQSKANQTLPLPRKFVEKFIHKSWRDLSLEMELKTGDRLVFKSIIVGLNRMSVTIHRKGS